jgi:hypothetical protein
VGTSQVNYTTTVLECVYRLHDAAIHSVSVNEGFCVTASADKYLRVWPLDFSDFFLEAQVAYTCHARCCAVPRCSAVVLCRV